eukprot:8319827-Alexandrium_andersonii.AAC.1
MRSNLGGFSTAGPRGESNSIKKHQPRAFLICHACGNAVPLRCSHISFSIIFSTIIEDTLFN